MPWLRPANSCPEFFGCRCYIFYSHFRIAHPGSISLSVLAQEEHCAVVQVSLAGKAVKIAIERDSAKWYPLGIWNSKDTGYLKIRLSGISTLHAEFPLVWRYKLSGTAIDAATRYVPNDEGDFFYWGRRGPSVHLNYAVSDTVPVAWFCNELTLPAGADKIGSYFMANGFAEGYFGIQVNSKTERRILFSVWSPLSKISSPKPGTSPEECYWEINVFALPMEYGWKLPKPGLALIIQSGITVWIIPEALKATGFNRRTVAFSINTNLSDKYSNDLR